MATVGIIGLGSVGGSVAYTLVLQKLCKYIYLNDRNLDKCHGEAEDLRDTGMDVIVQVWDLNDPNWRNVDVLIVTAGVKQSYRSRLEDLSESKAILQNIFGQIELQPSCKVIMVSNPVDLVTMQAQNLLEGRIPRSAIFGTGCMLDTYRLRSVLAEKLGVRARDVHANVFGEHGDSQFIGWSMAEVAGVPLTRILSIGERKTIESVVRNRAKSIIDKKGATYYGIARVVGDLVRCVLRDELVVASISTWHQDLGVCLSTLAVVGLHGVERTLNVELDHEEQAQLQRSAATLLRYAH